MTAADENEPPLPSHRRPVEGWEPGDRFHLAIADAEYFQTLREQQDEQVRKVVRRAGEADRG